MKLVLLSGGSGKRLWPLSNDQRSKQFIKILRNGDKMESMVQRVWHQLEEIGLLEDTYIATSESQRSILKNQLGISDNKIIAEPSRRDTFPAIALASCFLKSIEGISTDETIVVLPVDPYVDTSFFERIKDLKTLLEEEKATLGLLGIEPSFPSEKYGYIVPESETSRKVRYFQEKPDTDLAKKLIDDGAVWNAGIFCFKLSTILGLLNKMKITTNFDELINNYEILPKNSFDYEFTEKQNNIAFLRYEGCWKDLGTWNTLTEEMDSSSVGYAIEMIDTTNTHVINESLLPVAVIGATNLVVAAGPEGIFVSTKEASPRVKEISKEFFESIRFIEESWGNQYTMFETNNAQAIRYKVLDGKSISLNLDSNQTLTRLSGEGRVANTGRLFEITGINDFNFVVVTEEK